MIFDKRTDTLTLSTGRAFSCFGAQLGIGPAGVTHGWDGTLLEFDDGQPLTPIEREELAAFVIAQWTEWARGK